MTDSAVPTELRKMPRQDRSKAMVLRIVDAGQRVLIRDGSQKCSTNRIAAEAGISPGSLYQYFADKEAILSAVIERNSAQMSSQLTTMFAGQLGLPLPELVRASLNGLLDVLEANVEFLRLVTEQLPRANHGQKTAALEQRVSELIAAYLAIRKPLVRQHDPATVAWVLVRMVEHLAVQYVLETPPIPRAEFVDELSTMTLSYLGRELSPGQ